MRIVAVSTEVARIRNAVKAGNPDLKASHLAEAFARGLGFGSNAAFLEWDRQRNRGDLAIRDFDSSAASRRLTQLGSSIGEDELRDRILDCQGFATCERLGDSAKIGEPLEFEYGLVNAALRKLPEGKGARAGCLGLLMNWRVGSDYGMLDFVANYCSPRDRQLHLRLAAAIDRSKSLDPTLSTFLVDCLLTADQAYTIGDGYYPAWRDHAYWSYSMRVRTFVHHMMARQPLGGDAFEGSVPAIALPKRWRPTKPSGIEMTMQPTDRPGPFDAGTQGASDDKLVGMICMSLWRDGENDAAIDAVRSEASRSLPDVLAARFGIAYSSDVDRHPTQRHALDGFVSSTTRRRLQIAVLQVEEAERCMGQAAELDWSATMIDGPDPADELGGTDEVGTDLAWVALTNGGDAEILEQIIEAAHAGMVVMVSGLGRRRVLELEIMACRAAIGFGASASVTSDIPAYGVCSASGRARLQIPSPARSAAMP